ncbi:hypothetical protein BS50DRAFT_574561 [Corynespora cassiicola Philippines]|uniref:Uncharacterized protein n=1 Tax=Corynespora cassiicola Philippines TaxID=1448308 RepID=A0A2T2NKY8_CORCC|nr:hypothetical protein BS50DRAFT_574561 [Corynespora cassiicola Philippines]
MTAKPEPDQVLHPLHVVRQAAFIGGAAAIPGTITGAFFGTLRSNTPILFSIVSGAQWFGIGSTFYTIRTSILHSPGLQNWYNRTRGVPLVPRTDFDPLPSERTRASTIAGALTGATLGLIFRGPRNVIPGTLMFTIFGFAGQKTYDYFDEDHTERVKREKALRDNGQDKPKENFMQRIGKSKWSPFSVLSDEEYVKMMNEKILHFEVEIALIDERIEGLKKKQREMEEKRLHEEKTGQEKS